MDEDRLVISDELWEKIEPLLRPYQAHDTLSRKGLKNIRSF